MRPRWRVDEARRQYARGLTAAEVARRMGLAWSTSRTGAEVDGAPRPRSAPERLHAHAALAHRSTRRATPTCSGTTSATGTSPQAGGTCTACPLSASTPARRARADGGRAHGGAAHLEDLVRPTRRLRSGQELIDALDLPVPPTPPRTEAHEADHARGVAAADRRRPPRPVPPWPLPLRRLPDHQLEAPPRRRRVALRVPALRLARHPRLCCPALDRLGIAYRRPRWDQVSVARGEAVAALDRRVVPKT
jgi:hypothetical protein